MDALDIELAEQRSEVWYDIRLGRFTSSEIWKLMQSGKGKPFSVIGYTYIRTKVGECLTGVKVQNPYAAALVYGEEMEVNARAYFQNVTGYDIQAAEFVPFTDHSGGSPDGYVIEDSKRIAGLEIKCPFNSANQVEYLMLTDQHSLKAEFPEYYWQVQSAMLFTQLPKWFFVTYDPRMKEEKHKMKIIEVFPDVDDQALLIEKIELGIIEKQKLIEAL